MKKYLFLLVAMLSNIYVNAGEILIPSQAKNFSQPTTYQELTHFVRNLDSVTDILRTEVIGQSVEGRNLYALLFSSGEFGNDKSKTRVLIFAQQHGNEQSGKEGALLLALKLANAENKYLFDNIDLAIIPQVNPDGSELNNRRNGHNIDLNRNHLILTEPETRSLHRFFDKYLFEVTMDVHEYSPYGGEWKQNGCRKNSEVTLGVTTNVNVSAGIRNFSAQVAEPFILKYLSDKGFSSFVYCPGGPPGVDYFRHSTFDINDGRQSFGILNTVSFIQEGMNGEDSFVDNLHRRTLGQAAGMQALLEFTYMNNDRIKALVADNRKDLLKVKSGKNVSVQADHFSDGSKLMLPVFSYSSGNDTTVQVTDYRPVVKSTYDIKRPLGYLIPANNAELADWLKIQNIAFCEYKPGKHPKIEQYFIRDIDSTDFEGDMIINPIVESSFTKIPDAASYLFVPVRQLKSNLIIQALEPKSMLGLITYKQYSHLVKTGTIYPVLRVIN